MEEQKKLSEEQNKQDLRKFASDVGAFVIPSDNGTEEKDYCESCQKYIDQIEVEKGAFGCPICKSQKNITTFYNGGEE